MPALPSLRPNGQGTLSSVNNQAGATTNIYLDIDDDPDSPVTTDYIKNATDTSGDKTAFILFDDMPSDFGRMSDIQINCHIAVATFVNDTCTLFARIYQSDETTALTDEVQVATQAQTGLRTISFTTVTQGTKAIWDGARLRLRWAYNRVSSADGAQLRVNAVELNGNYLTGALISGAAALIGTGSQTISGGRRFSGAAALSGSGTQVVSGIRKTFGASGLVGASTQSISGLPRSVGTASLSATSSLTISGVVISMTFCGAGGWAGGAWAGLAFGGFGFCENKINLIPSPLSKPHSNVLDLCLEWC